MKQIIRFQTRDNREFDNADEALCHEILLDKIDKLIKQLPAKPRNDGNNFANGKGYLQHNSITTTTVKHALVNLWQGSENIKKEARDSPVFESQLCTILADSNSPIYPVWYRLGCIDKKWREWGQPYFTRHPKSVTLIKLN